MIPDSWRGQNGEGTGTQAIAPIADAGLFQQTDAMPDWDGSMRECALLGARTEQIGS